jgi:hypothetical protein
MYIVLGILILIIVLIIFINNETIRRDSFISPTFKNKNPHCPDYLAYDGTYYYLVNNNSPEKIKTYETLDEAYNYLNVIGCPKFNPISLVRKKNNNDPQESINRKCTKKVAINQFLEDIYNYSINEENSSAENLNKDLDINKQLNLFPDYLKQYNDSLTKLLGTEKPSNKEEIKLAINNYIKNASPKELTSYLQENCMINEYISNKENTGDFYDNYNSINILDELLADSNNESLNNDIINNKNDVEYPLMNEVWNINKPITNLMMNKLFSI